jgi:ankyrin repeat protein
MDEDVRSCVARMPKGLSKTYQQIYNQISAHENQKLVVDRAFIWVMCSFGPMTGEQLLAAIRHDENHNHLGSKITTNRLLSLCKNLLVFDELSNCFRFCHASVSEYIEDELWNSQRAHCYAAKSCLRFLLLAYGEPASSVPTSRHRNNETTTQNNTKGTENSVIFEEDYPFHHYSRDLWMHHVQHQEPVEQNADESVSELITLLKAFLNSPTNGGTVYKKWYEKIRRDRWAYLNLPLAVSYAALEDISPPTLPILAMCRFALDTVLTDWWKRDEMFLPHLNEENESPLILAVKASCLPICDRLLTREASIDHCGKDLNALAAAALDGNLEMTRLLIEQGATVDLELPGKCGSALAYASWCGSSDVVEYLIQNGAQVNKPLQGDYGSALAAAACDSIETTKLLIRKGATIDMPLEGRYGSALAAAAFHSITTTAYLIENGATVNIPLQGWFGSALAAAANSGIETTGCLIDNGATVDMPLAGWYGSALAAAASSNLETTAYLIEKRATVDMPLQGGYGSALAAAAFHSIETTAYLIENGATINMPLQGWFGSALAAAACDSNETTSYLIEKGAIVDMLLQGRYGSALAAAACYRIDTTELLIKKGATVDMHLQGWYGSALAAATSRGCSLTSHLLVNIGATVDLVLSAGRFGSALSAAAATGWVVIVTYLVHERKANVNLPLIAGSYGTALNAASHWGQIECVKILLSAGAIGEISQDHCGFNTALEAAQAELCEDILFYEQMKANWEGWGILRSEAQIAADKNAVLNLLLNQHSQSEESLEVRDRTASESSLLPN